MRVLVVTNVESGGGTEKHVRDIVKLLGVDVYYLERGFAGLYRRLVTRYYDCVHFFLPKAYVLGTLACELTRFKGRRIYSRRAMIYGHHPVYWLLEPLCHYRTDILVGNSPAVVEELRGESRGDIRLIRNGIDFKALPHRDSGRFTIVCVANLWRHKHQEVLIEAFKIANIPNSRLVLVGRGTEQFNFHENVYGYGYRNDIPEILSTADVFVMPSVSEGCPNAVLEAMVAGVPVIAADAGGNQDIIVHGLTGILVPPKEPGRLAYAIMAAARCPKQFKLMAENARASVAKRFSMDVCIQKYEELYD